MHTDPPHPLTCASVMWASCKYWYMTGGLHAWNSENDFKLHEQGSHFNAIQCCFEWACSNGSFAEQRGHKIQAFVSEDQTPSQTCWGFTSQIWDGSSKIATMLKAAGFILRQKVNYYCISQAFRHYTKQPHYCFYINTYDSVNSDTQNITATLLCSIGSAHRWNDFNGFSFLE